MGCKRLEIGHGEEGGLLGFALVLNFEMLNQIFEFKKEQ